MNIISNLVETHIFRETENGIEFLLLKRAADKIYPGVWQMVSGKINDNEKAFETSVREIREETGLTPETMWVAPKVNSFYSAVSDTICLIPVFAAKVAKDSIVIISDEHSEYTWVNPSKAKKLLAWDGQRRAIDLIEKYYLNEKDFLNFVKIYL